ncbi:MAG TPA: class I SAM-dependent methyltransferase [Abditibacteriaceae bacterium]|jgi:SAM-dependent methyltransferase
MNSQFQFWQNAFASDAWYYGADAGTVARRAVRYATTRGKALDCGCGEGQDLAFLAASGFGSTGLDFTASGVEKTRRILASRGLQGEALQADLSTFDFAPLHGRFSLVLCVNALQFLGAAAPRVLGEIAACVAPGGVLGLSVFAPGGSNTARDDIWLCSIEALVETLAPRFTMHETCALSQWHNGVPQPFATLVARRKDDQ